MQWDKGGLHRPVLLELPSGRHLKKRRGKSSAAEEEITPRPLSFVCISSRISYIVFVGVVVVVVGVAVVVVVVGVEVVVVVIAAVVVVVGVVTQDKVPHSDPVLDAIKTLPLLFMRYIASGFFVNGLEG